MADKSPIEWTEATWSPTVGCSVLSPGCTNCTWGPRNPDGNRDALSLIAEFCWALGVTPHIELAPREDAP